MLVTKVALTSAQSICTVGSRREVDPDLRLRIAQFNRPQARQAPCQFTTQIPHLPEYVLPRLH